MTSVRIRIAALTLLALPATLAAQHGPMSHPPVPADDIAAPTPVFLMKAGASDLFERQSGQLLSTSRNPRVARFAREAAVEVAERRGASGRYVIVINHGETPARLSLGRTTKIFGDLNGDVLLGHGVALLRRAAE